LTDVAASVAALTGIGPAKTEEILVYREMFGSFRASEELLAVFGIGAATLEKTAAGS
jgi:competence protein ComEA